MPTATRTLEIRPLTPLFAADVVGTDLAEPMPEDTFRAIVAAWHQHGVVRFRGQRISSEHLKNFSARFGALQIHIHREFVDPDHPEILLLSNRKRADGSPLGMAETGRRWHSDLQYAETPCIASLLFGEATPSIGGDTLFASMTAAYDALPAATKRRLEGMQAIQSYAKTTYDGVKAARDKKVPDVIHPAVLVHPVTGRKALYVSESMTRGFVGLPDVEGQALLDELVAHSTQPQFVWAQKWLPGDAVLWDNRAVVHKATPYDMSQTRHMKRTTIMPAFAGI